MSTIPVRRVRSIAAAAALATMLVIPSAAVAETLEPITVEVPWFELNPDFRCQPDSPGNCNSAPGQMKKKECTIDPATGQLVCRTV